MNKTPPEDAPNKEMGPKFRSYATMILLIVSIVSTLGLGLRKYDLTFDSQEQKHEVLDLLEKKDPITPIEADHAIQHMHDSGMHMTFEEKKKFIIIEQNQIKIGQDLQEIKKLIKNNNP